MRLSSSTLDTCAQRRGRVDPGRALRVRATARSCSASRSASSRDAATRASSTARRSGESDPSASAASSAMASSRVDVSSTHRNSTVVRRSSSVEADASARRNDPVLPDGSERFSRVRASDAARARRRRVASSSGRRTRTRRPTSSSARATSTRPRYLAALIADGRDVVTIANDWDLDGRRTRDRGGDARRGADVIYQACFVDGALARLRRLRRAAAGRPLRGRRHEARAPLEAVLRAAALLLLGAGRAASRGAHARADARRARNARAGEPARRRLPRVLPPRARAVRRARSRPGSTSTPCRSRSAPAATSSSRCESRWRADDHLSLVARMRPRPGRPARAARASHTVAELAGAPPTTPVRPRWRRAPSRRCATRRRCRSPRARAGTAWKVLAPEPKRGFELLPPPSAGDLFFDIEGDPFWEPGRGLEYLWGIVDTAGAFRPFWAHDRAQERRAVEGVIDLIRERRARRSARCTSTTTPPTRSSALKRLTCEYGTREDELDDLLRDEVFVDLYKVVSQGLRLSHERYGLKQVETFYFERARRPARRRRLDRALRGLARASRPGDPRRHRRLQRGGLRLDARAARLAAAAAARRGAAARASPSRASRPTTRPRRRSSRQALLAGLPDDPHEVADADRPRWLLAQLAALPPPRGEAGLVGVLRQDRADRARSCRSATRTRSAGSSRPGRRSRSGDSLRLAVHVPGAAAPPRCRAATSSTRRPAGRPGRSRRSTRRPGRCSLRRGPIARGRAAAGRADPGRPVHDARAAGRAAAPRALRARRRRALSARPSRSSCASRSRARSRRTTSTPRRRLVAEPRRPPPRDPGPARLGQDLHGRAADRAPDAPRPARRRDLDEPQGDPQPDRRGRARRTRDGRRVPRAEEGRLLRGAVRHDLRRTRRTSPSPRTTCCCSRGTAWLFSREDMEGVVDTLFVDEAGQVSLADALARRRPARATSSCSATRSSSVRSRRGSIPKAPRPRCSSTCSATRTPCRRTAASSSRARGACIPDVCRFISETSYEGRLHVGARVRSGSGSTRPGSRARGCAGCPSSTRANRGVVDRGGRPDRRRARAS